MLRRLFLLLLLVATTSFGQEPPCMTITSVSPASGPPGTRVTITGTNFFGCCFFECPAPAVSFDGIPAAIVSRSSTQIIAIAPPHQGGTVTVTVQQLAGGASSSFTYLADVPTLGLMAALVAAVALIVIAMMKLR